MDLEQKSIERIKLASEMSLRHYQKPLVCTYSGGKDSDVMLELFKRSGIPFEVSHSLTTADAPQTVYHVRKVFRELESQGIRTTIDKHEYTDKTGKKHRTTMWNLITKKGIPPTRLVRYCCVELKETFGSGRFIATGVRWGESTKRKEWGSFSQPEKRLHATDEIMMNSDNDIKRRLNEHCMQKNKMVVNPIIDWSNTDIWEFIRQEKICTNPLYEMGFDRVGCIGCPIAGRKRWFEFYVFPKFQDAYIRAFDKMLAVRKLAGKDDSTGKWKSASDVFLWWMEDDNVEGQMSFDDFPEVMP